VTTSRRTVLLGVGVSLVAGAGGGWLSRWTASHSGPAADTAGPATPAPLSIARVVRTDLRTTRQYYGTIGYGSAIDLVATTSGRAFTWLPAPAP
jgi:hypothetical protein